MRIAVYDRYWSTLGGGEQFAGGIAAALRSHHDVDLVGPEPIDTGRFAERLSIDLAGLRGAPSTRRATWLCSPGSTTS